MKAFINKIIIIIIMYKDSKIFKVLKCSSIHT